MLPISGRTTVTTAGTEVVLGNMEVHGAVMVKALHTNTGLVYIGESGGGVSSTTGMHLNADDVVIFQKIGDLSDIWVDSAVNLEGVAWLLLNT